VGSGLTLGIVGLWNCGVMELWGYGIVGSGLTFRLAILTLALHISVEIQKLVI